MNTPKGATHYWSAAGSSECVFGTIHRLGYYRQVEGEWWVYSDVTNWRKSQNPPEWFNKEIEEGFFKEINV